MHKMHRSNSILVSQYMQKLVKVIRWALIGVLSLVVLILVGLNIYYGYAKRNLTPPALTTSPESSSEWTADPSTHLTNLLPIPKHLEYFNDTISFPEKLTFLTSSSWAKTVKDFTKLHFGLDAEASDDGWLIALQDDTIPEQGYQIHLTAERLLIRFRNAQSLYYALVTLRNLYVAHPQGIPALTIRDFPDYPVRGVLLDISRDKTPTLATLYALVDYLALLKYNRLELYMEGFAFAYPSFRRHWEGKETPLTGDEIRRLDQYCRDRFIDLVPNQNSLGHMQAWLATDEFASLAECPKGYRLMGLIDMKSTLNVSNPLSLELVKKMSDDLLPNFTSSNFNVNMDEPFELGECRNKGQNKGQLYLEYTNRLYSYITAKNKKVFMWADVISHHPELMNQLPSDITLLEWGYDAQHPFAQACRKYQQAKRPYYVCPGTSSWTSLTGRTDNMLRNIDNAVQNGYLYGASGFLNTDWGDLGHWQYLPVSIPGLTYGAAQSWHVGSAAKEVLPFYMDRFYFRDSTGQMGQLTLDLGRYQRYEEFDMFNMTLANLSLQFGLMDGVMFDRLLEVIPKKILALMPYDTLTKNALARRLTTRRPYDYHGLQQFLLTREQRLLSLDTLYHQELYVQEYLNAIDMVRLGSGLKYYLQYQHTWSNAERLSHLEKLQTLVGRIIPAHRNLWSSRNKQGGLERSLTAFNKLKDQLNREITHLRQPNWQQWLRGIKDHTLAAAGSLYLAA